MSTLLDESGEALLDEGGDELLDEASVLAATPATSPRAGRWALYVRDATGARVAQLDTWTAATLVLRYNAVGDWSLKAPTSAAATLLNEPQYGIEFVRDGDVVLSGPVTSRSRRFDATFDGYDFAGKDDAVWLTRRLASPQPATSSPPYNSSAYDVRTGTASTVLREYVTVNAGPGAVVDRVVSGLTIGTDPSAGGTVTGRARWQVLLDLLVELATAAGLGFRVRDLTFEVYQPVDRSDAVKFSVPLGNLAAFTYTEAAPTLNYVFVAGGGEGTARTIREASDSGSVTAWGRIEALQDRRDTTDTTELDQAATSTLAENATKTGFSLTPIETASIRYLDSYDLGDQVTVIVDGVAIVDVVREVVINLTDTDGEKVTPTVGDPNANPARPRIFEQVARLGRRMRDLERTQ